jgi:hypothetical protein
MRLTGVFVAGGRKSLLINYKKQGINSPFRAKAPQKMLLQAHQ